MYTVGREKSRLIYHPDLEITCAHSVRAACSLPVSYASLASPARSRHRAPPPLPPFPNSCISPGRCIFRRISLPGL